MSVNVVVTGRIPEGLVVIEAFPSRGYVSTLAANHLIKQMKMELVGYIECDKLDAIAVVHDGKPMHPIRLYRKDGLAIIFSELIIPFNFTHEFTKAIAVWMAKIKPKSAMFLASIPGVETDKEHEIMAVSTDESMSKKILANKIKMLDEGVLTGISSSLMLKCIEQKIPATAIMVETTYVPNILASAALLDLLNSLLGLKVDTQELIKAGEEIKTRFESSLEQLKKGQENYQELHQDSLMYR